MLYRPLLLIAIFTDGVDQGSHHPESWTNLEMSCNTVITPVILLIEDLFISSNFLVLSLLIINHIDRSFWLLQSPPCCLRISASFSELIGGLGELIPSILSVFAQAFHNSASRQLTSAFHLVIRNVKVRAAWIF